MKAKISGQFCHCKTIKNLSVVVHAYCPSTWEAEGGRW